MRLTVPDVNPTLALLMNTQVRFGGENMVIGDWLRRHRAQMRRNRRRANEGSEAADIWVLRIFLHNLLVRAIRGEMGLRLEEALAQSITCRADLNDRRYRRALEQAGYRWGIEPGVAVIRGIVDYFSGQLNWDWAKYLNDAQRETDNGFRSDPLLALPNVGLKVRDLALSDLSPHYPAFDRHVARIVTRLGWLNFGFDILDGSMEMGNDPSNKDHYLFLHKLFNRLSEMTEGTYSPVDLDRTFWHLGKSICGKQPKCGDCPIRNACPTGRARTRA